MATSTIKLYEVFFNPSNNCRIDDFEFYLYSGLRSTFLDHQYVKQGLDITVKLDLPQSNVTNNDWNYVSIINSDDTKTYYYFIMDTRWLSMNTVELRLSIDSINTFWSDFTPLFTNNTLVTRRHKDRFKQVTVPSSFSSLNLIRNVDAFDEGINPTKFRKAEPTRLPYKSNLDLDWYLIYKTEKPLTEGDQSNPLQCYLCSNIELPTGTTVTSRTITPSSLSVGECRYFTKYDNPNFSATIHGETFNWTRTYSGGGKGVGVILQGNSIGIKITVITSRNTSDGIVYEPLSYGILNFDFVISNSVAYRSSYTNTSSYDDILKMPLVQFATGTSSVMAFKDVDKTDSKIMKIIKLPYPPCEVSVSGSNYSFDSTKFVYYANERLMKAVSLDVEFESNLLHTSLQSNLSKTITSTSLGTRKAKDITYESKLYNSNLYTLKLMYDQFSKEVLLERWNKNATLQDCYMDLKFKPSNNIQSKFLFKASTPNYNEIDDFGEYIVVDRNNEVSLFNNDYLNYIRYSYDFDKTSRQQRTVATGIASGVSLALGIAGLVAGAGTGGVSAAAGISLISGALASSVSIVNESIASERSIAQKKDQLANQSGSVTASDTNLMSYYSGNRLSKVEYEPSETMRNNIWNLFYLTGYKDNTYMVPNFNTRINFDFVQCIPEFQKQGWKYPKTFLDDITQRLQGGITVYHKQGVSYDFEQQYENFENWMVN